jgi:hypothetical protein
LRKNINRRHRRLAFLHVARDYPWVTEMARSHTQMWKLLKAQIGRTQEFTHFFAKCAGLIEILSRSDKKLLSHIAPSKWIGINPEPPCLSPFSDVELEELLLKAHPLGQR